MLKQSIKNKIFIHFVVFTAVFICVFVAIVSWQLKKSSEARVELLRHELATRLFSKAETNHTVTLKFLDAIRERVKSYGAFISQNSPIADTIKRHQTESIVDFLQLSAIKMEMDFALVFDEDGILVASSGGSKGFRPGDLDLPRRIELYQTFPGSQKVNDILMKEISLQISPQEALEGEIIFSSGGFVRANPGLLSSLGVFPERSGKKGAIALVGSGIIRDDFSVPVGMFIAGKLIIDLDKLFQGFHLETGTAVFLYLDDTLTELAGVPDEEWENYNNSPPKIGQAETIEIEKNKRPTNLFLSLATEKYLSSCSLIEDDYQNEIGILCSGVPESEINSTQMPIMTHAVKTRQALQQWLVLSGISMIFLSILLARIIAFGITKKLEHVIDFTKMLREGDMSHRLKDQSPDEIGTLSRSIDTMLDNLSLAMEEKEKLEVLLRQAHKMEAIGTLAGGIAHDFNNLLAIIMGYTQLAQYEAPKDSKFAGNLKMVLKAGNRAKDLVQQILAFSRHSQVQLSPLQLLPLIKEELKMLRSSLPTTIEIRSDLAPEGCVVFADPTQVHQIIMNLCTNAYHAMEQTGGILNIAMKMVCLEKDDPKLALNLKPGEYVELIVTDTGKGIGLDIIEKIFEPYFTTKEQGRGTGMGLAIIHGIVASYDGAISVESEPGKGTTFHVYLPVAKQDETMPSRRAEELVGGKERILFIDDEELMAQLGKDMLERLGYSVTVRQRGIDALSTFQEAPDAFDLIITDQTMPGMTGSELAREMLLIRPDIPVVLCTGYSSTVDEKSAKTLGIKEFAFKPLDEGALANLIRKVLDE